MTRVARPSPHPTTFVDVDNGRRAVLDVPPGAGAPRKLPVVLVPGYMGSKEDFTPILDGLADAGHRVVALDLAGQWESSPGSGPAADEPASYLPSALAADLPQVLGRLGIDRAHLLGHSYGGLVARAAVLADPSPYASLTLLCTGPAGLTGERRKGTELMAGIAMAMELGPLYDALLDYWAGHGEELPPADALDFQRARFTGGRQAALAGMGTGLLGEPDRVTELRDVAAQAGLPVTVVYGERDDAWLPAEQDDMAARLGSPAVVIPGAGHSPAYDAPAALLEVLTARWS